MRASYLLLATPLVIVGLGRRYMKHHDAAFNQSIWEIWENPTRNRNIPIEDTARMKKINAYLESGMLNIILNEPPLGAYERFKDISVEEYNEHIKGMALDRLNSIKNKAGLT